MAYTSASIQGTGIGPYTIPFNYRDPASVEVLVDGLHVGYSFVGTPTAHQPAGTGFVLAQGTSKQITVKKSVSLDTLAVEWSDGASLNEDNLESMSLNLMEMAQTAYDAGGGARSVADATSNRLDELSSSLNEAIAAAQSNASTAEYWAGIALSGASVANPGEIAELARDAAIAARDAAQLAAALALQYKDLAELAKTSSEASASSASSSASAADTSRAQAQAIVDAGSLRWNGSLKFVSTLDPDPSVGTNGDFWFKREP